MSTRDRWLDAGLEVLAQDGAPALRIDRLAARLGLSKGSFHHHFSGAAGYKVALLDRYEQLLLADFANAIASAESASPRDMLAALTSRVGTQRDPLLRAELQVGVRAWAFQDEMVREAQQRIDGAIVGKLQEIWSRLVDDPVSARSAALLPYLVGVGASVVLPPIAPAELQRVYELLLGLVPRD